MSLDVGERVYAADVDYPMAVVGTAGRGLCIYTLEGQPKEYKRVEPPLKYQHRCISIFRDKKAQPAGSGQYCKFLLYLTFLINLSFFSTSRGTLKRGTVVFLFWLYLIKKDIFNFYLANSSSFQCSLHSPLPLFLFSFAKLLRC